MKKYVSLDKRSKKAQKEYFSEKRVTVGELNPVTRSVPSGKSYNRKKDKQEMRRADLRSGDGFEVSSFFVCFEIKQMTNVIIRMLHYTL